MYRKFLSELSAYCPHIKVVGMSATPFRLDSGPLIKGDKRLFTDIAYQVSIRDLIDQGFLSPLVSAKTKRTDTSMVAKRGGEYITGDLERVMDASDITRCALDEVESLCADRKSWLVFCVGVDHAHHVSDAIRARGYSSAVIIGSTPAHERSERLSDFKAGRLRSLVSVGVLTTGFDAPCADALICLRPTCSPGLWIQIVGRVTRLHPGKENGLVLDFTQNTLLHGPIDQIEIDGDGNVKTNPPKICVHCGGLIYKRGPCPECGKEQERPCPKCGSPVPLKQTICMDCGYDLSRPPREPNHATTASNAEILSTDRPIAKDVQSWTWNIHAKYEKPDSIRVRYCCWDGYYDEWICFDHGGFAARKAGAWWRSHRGGIIPMSTREAIARQSECVCPSSIIVRKDKKYWRIVSFFFDTKELICYR
jgi:DNA repair protein RadD